MRQLVWRGVQSGSYVQQDVWIGSYVQHNVAVREKQDGSDRQETRMKYRQVIKGTGSQKGGGHMLQVNDLTVRYGDLTIVDHLGFTVEEGQWLMIVGPNGAGKSTTLNAITQGTAYTGQVLFEGEDMKKKKAAERARCVGVLMQNHFAEYAFSVEEVVALGRYSRAGARSRARWYAGSEIEFKGEFAGTEGKTDVRTEKKPAICTKKEPEVFTERRPGVRTKENAGFVGKSGRKSGLHAGKRASRSDEDEQAVENALALTGMISQRKQSILTLSGGELQRTFLAQVFAQDPKLLLLDEPTNHLDLVYQKQVFELIEKWLQTPGRAVISVVHDLSLAKAYGTKVLLMNHGRKVACGPAAEVLVPEHLDPVYQMDVGGWMRQMLGQWNG